LTKIEFTEDAAQIVDLWHRVFGDDEAYIRFFLDNCPHKCCVGAFVGERLVRGVIQEFEENNSGVDLFHFDSDEDVFCVYSQYIDDLMLLSKMIRAACDNEKTMGMYLNMSEVAKA